MFDDRLFFQIAVGLIPALLFGGLVSGVFEPSHKFRSRPFRSRLALLIAITAGVAVGLLAELFAIDLATSPDPPATFKIMVVVAVVVGATALAGYALIRPWIDALASRHVGTVNRVVQIVGLLLIGVGIVMLSDSIVEARNRLTDQRVTCLEAESERRLRDSRLDVYAALDAVDARFAEVMVLSEKRIKLEQEKGLSRTDRRFLGELLDQQFKHATNRWKAAEKQRSSVAQASVVDFARKLEDLDDKTFENYMRAFGC